MRRKAIAAVWILGATVPVVLATVFVVGCCVLPFHGLMHKLMPLCEMAAAVMRGAHNEHGQHDHESTPPTPRQKDDSGPRLVTVLQSLRRVADPGSEATAILPGASETAYRSFISLGAVRCDQDVGLHVFVALFRI